MIKISVNRGRSRLGNKTLRTQERSKQSTGAYEFANGESWTLVYFATRSDESVACGAMLDAATHCALA
jgi:hypothetical protein